MSTTAILSLSGAVAVAIAAGLVIALHLLPTGLDPTANPVSQYGRTRFSGLYRAQVVASGTSGLLLLAALASAGVRRPLPLVALGAYGLARIAIAGNMMDLSGEVPTARGRNHLMLALVAFAGIAVAAVPLTGALEQTVDGALGRGLAISAGAVPVAAVLMFATRGSPSLRRHFGAFERLFYVAAFAWLFIASVSLATNGAAPGG